MGRNGGRVAGVTAEAGSRRRCRGSHPWVGKKIGNLEIKRLIGQGRSADVLLAREDPPGRLVAVKILSDEFSRNPAAVADFIEEARRAAKLRHPNILDVYRVAMYKDRYFIVLEYADGGTLADLLMLEGKLSLKEAAQYMSDSARGLAYAATCGLVHRDIKPENLLIAQDGTVKVADLGIAGKTGQHTDQGDSIFGTAHYIAPEQALGEPASSKSDIYSLGATFYHLLTGRTPFKNAGVNSLILNHLHDKPTPVNRIVPTLPKRASVVIERMMEKDPRDRFEDFNEVLEELGALTRLKTLDKLRLGDRKRRK